MTVKNAIDFFRIWKTCVPIYKDIIATKKKEWTSLDCFNRFNNWGSNFNEYPKTTNAFDLWEST